MKSTMKPSDFLLPYPKTTAVECRPDYTLAIEFDNGEHGLPDMEPYLDKGIFLQLREPAMFRTARIAFGAVTWDNEADLHPAWVYHKCNKTSVV